MAIPPRGGMWLRVSKPRKQENREAPRLEIPFKRVRATLRNEASRELTGGRVFLSDLSVTGVGLFLESPLRGGDGVAIVIEGETPFVMRGRVVWCAPYTLNMKVLSVESFMYRAGIRFEFHSSAELFRVKEYVDRLFARAEF